MGVFEMVVLIVFIATVGKIVDSAVSRPRAGADTLPPGRVQELEAQLHANDARLTEAEAKVAELGEKLDFVEKLLAPGDWRGQISPGDRHPPP